MYCRPAKDGSEEKRNDKQRIVHLPQGTDEEHPDQQQGRGRECPHHAILVPSGTAPRQQGESADEDEYCGENAPQPYRCSAGAEVHTDTDDQEFAKSRTSPRWGTRLSTKPWGSAINTHPTTLQTMGRTRAAARLSH